MTNVQSLAQGFTHCGYCENSINIATLALSFPSLCACLYLSCPRENVLLKVSRSRGAKNVDRVPSGLPKECLELYSPVWHLIFFSVFLAWEAGDIFQRLKSLILPWWGACFLCGISRNSHRIKTSCQIFLAGPKLSLRFQPRTTLLLGLKSLPHASCWKLLLLEELQEDF